MALDFDALRAAGRQVRAARLARGLAPPKKRRARPRSAEEIALLRQAHRDKLKKYPPRYEDGVLILPYYYDPAKP